jgi:hypothetical protein
MTDTKNQDKPAISGGQEAAIAPPPQPVPGPAAGTEEDTQPVSKIISIADDVFWIKYAKESIEGAKKACDDAAQNLIKIVTWIWPIYTATFASASIFFQAKIPENTRIFLAIPIPLIFTAYWAAQFVLLPVFTKFDPRIPYEIRREFNHVMSIKKFRLKLANFLCLLAVIFLSLGLYYIREKALDGKPLTPPATQSSPGTKH